jgi:membrane protease YdiL (CAAX protease family)
MQRLTRRDWFFIAICAAVFAISLAITLTNFARAFPEAAIDFRFDRGTSQPIAERVLAGERIAAAAMRHTVAFNSDDAAKIFLERTLGLDRARAVMRNDVRLWAWHHRWFVPLQEEELSADVAPTGEVIGFRHVIPEARAIPTPDVAAARAIAEAFLNRNGMPASGLQLVSQSERNLPHRVQRIFTWESRRIRPANAPYRTLVRVDGNVVTEFGQGVKVPDEWQRQYTELRSKNQLAGQIDSIFLIITMIASVIVFIRRLLRRDVSLRFLLGIAIASLVLVAGNAINHYPSELASYDTTTSFPAFQGRVIINTILGIFGTAMFLGVICGSGEVLFRERMPSQIAIPRVWSRRSLRSKRVFLAFVLGYTLVPFFIAYQTLFYIFASKHGAWSPLEVPYDDLLNSAIPWVAVLFAGFFPAFSEEFMSRAFSLPFFERVLRSRWAAIIAAGFIWGFGHATYPNQPFYIRGVEVGIAGCVIGFLFYRFGLLPTLIWHYTVDATYTALLLFRSHNVYYIASAAAASFVFAIPMLIAIALYLKRGGFEPDDDLTNATLPVSAPPPPLPARAAVALPPAIRVTPRLLIICAVALCAAAALVTLRPPSPDDAIDYRITKAEAKRIAVAHLQRVQPAASYARVIATPLDGFRRWDRDSGREDGGAPGGFDSDAAEYMLRRGLTMRGLIDVFRARVQAGTWTVRFFTPMKKDEYFVEVDPRTSRAVGFHKYQSEATPGAQLEEAQALAIAKTSFAVHALDANAFDVKEALSFQQPKRRDWLFHFDERRPIVADAFRRVTVRVARAEVTQFTTTIHVPESVYREASTQTLRNIALAVVRVAGGIALLAFIVAGVVGAAIRHRPSWSRALRWTFALAIVPIVSVAAEYESSLFGYSTSVKWDTFFTGLAVDVVRDIALRLGILFLAVAAVDAAIPYALDAISREGRARFGRNAVIAAVTVVAAFAAVRGAMQLVALRFPAAVDVTLNVPNVVAMRAPSLVTILEALFDAVVGCGVVTAFIFGIRAIPKGREAVAVFVIFAAALHPDATLAQMPLMLIRAAALAVLMWALARFVLNGNVLAWPLAVFTAVMLNGIDAMMSNHRGDLRMNAIVAGVALLAALAWAAVPRSEADA